MWCPLLSGGCIDCVYVRVFDPVHVAPVNCCWPMLETGWDAAVVELGCIGACGEFAKPFCCKCGETGEFAPENKTLQKKTNVF